MALVSALLLRGCLPGHQSTISTPKILPNSPLRDGADTPPRQLFDESGPPSSPCWAHGGHSGGNLDAGEPPASDGTHPDLGDARGPKWG